MDWQKVYQQFFHSQLYLTSLFNLLAIPLVYLVQHTNRQSFPAFLISSLRCIIFWIYLHIFNLIVDVLQMFNLFMWLNRSRSGHRPKQSGGQMGLHPGLLPARQPRNWWVIKVISSKFFLFLPTLCAPASRSYFLTQLWHLRKSCFTPMLRLQRLSYTIMQEGEGALQHPFPLLTFSKWFIHFFIFSFKLGDVWKLCEQHLL